MSPGVCSIKLTVMNAKIKSLNIRMGEDRIEEGVLSTSIIAKEGVEATCVISEREKDC